MNRNGRRYFMMMTKNIFSLLLAKINLFRYTGRKRKMRNTIAEHLSSAERFAGKDVTKALEEYLLYRSFVNWAANILSALNILRKWRRNSG